MPSVPKTLRREHSSETIVAIITLHKVGISPAKIGDQLTLSRSTVATILHRHARQPDQPLQPSKRSGRPCKLDDRDRRTLMRHVEHENLKALGTLSKSGHTVSQPTVRKTEVPEGEGFF